MTDRVNRRVVLIIGGVAAVLGLVAWPGATQKDLQAFKTEIHRGHRVVASEALVKFRGTPALDQVEQEVDADRVEEVGGNGLRLLRSRSHDVDTLLSILSARLDVEFAEPNFVVDATATPSDTSFPSLWGLLNTGQSGGTPGADIDAVPAWDLSTGSRENVVAVVDTGFDYAHPDLVANVWSASRSFTVTVGGRLITCAAGTHGFNAITNTCDPADDNNHGTHVSGTIGATGNNALGVVGVNWVASIMGLKFLDRNGSGTTANAINAVEFAVQAKQVLGAGANVRVLSNSWGGGGFSQALLDEINRANSANMLFVAAAGNSGSDNDSAPFYPSNYGAANVVAVAATDNRDQLASFSNYGLTSVDLGAPGVSILSTIPGAQYGYGSGTSMATPHVSGAAALVLSRCAVDTAALKSVLLSSVDPVSSLSGRAATGGRLNAYKAVYNCAPAPPPPPTQDFTIAASPASLSLRRGSSGSYSVRVGSVEGFSGSVGLAVTGIPAGVTATFNPASVSVPANGSVTSTLTVTTGRNASRGTFTLTISGTGQPNGSTVSHATSVSLTVTK